MKMEPQLTKKMKWLEIDGPCGTEWVALDGLNEKEIHLFLNAKGEVEMPSNIQDYFENQIVWSAKVITGYGVRCSSPGYLDSTPWIVYTNLKEAEKAYDVEMQYLQEEQ